MHQTYNKNRPVTPATKPTARRLCWVCSVGVSDLHPVYGCGVDTVGRRDDVPLPYERPAAGDPLGAEEAVLDQRRAPGVLPELAVVPAHYPGLPPRTVHLPAPSVLDRAQVRVHKVHLQ